MFEYIRTSAGQQLNW